MIASFLMLAAAADAKAIPKPKSSDVAVIDCQVKRVYTSYPMPSTPIAIGNERWVFHVKSWNDMKRDNVIKYVAAEKGDMYGNTIFASFFRDGSKINIDFIYPDLASGSVKMTTARRGVATLSTTEQNRHGDGGYEINGECKTQLKSVPRKET